MYKFAFIGFFFLLIAATPVFGQKAITKKDSIAASKTIVKDTLAPLDIDPLTPAKAAFYSAILPGLGQAYNKKYWKIPLVYGAIGTSMYFYIDNNKKYHDVRDAYKRRIEGYNDDDFQYLDEDRLVSAQKFYQRNRDLSALFVVGFYILNIIDANVDAALIQFNVNDRLSLKPNVYTNDVTFKPNVALTFNYNF